VPELPEVEVLARHLSPLIRGQKIAGVEVRRARTVLPDSPQTFARRLNGARFVNLSRRGKYLLFELTSGRTCKPMTLVGHLGMTGRMYFLPKRRELPKHAAVVLDFVAQNFVFEDTRYFGRLTFDANGIAGLGPEPMSEQFTIEGFSEALRCSAQPIKVKLLDQGVVAGVGNIYASEALFRAKISPRLAAKRMSSAQVAQLRDAIRETLSEAIELGSTVPLNYSGEGACDGLFYFGGAPDAPDFYEERLRVYDRAGKACITCGTPIKRIVQGARSTYYCPKCQR
jgi:formamidopyrimidine-DNA glycosylase